MQDFQSVPVTQERAWLRSVPGLIAGMALMLVIGAGSAAAQASGERQYSPRPSWPSQSQPQQPIEVRICSCLYAGENVPIGQTICMKYEGRRVLATCGTVVNNPSWSISSKNCPEA